MALLLWHVMNAIMVIAAAGQKESQPWNWSFDRLALAAVNWRVPWWSLIHG